MKSLVSVIVPIYKVEQYLRQCLDSIVCQSHTNIQVIMVNDGSPDNCESICDEYCEKDCRFELVNKKNGGLASARNAGLEHVRGEFVVCVDSDDWIEPDMIEVLLKNLEDYNADMSVCSFYENRIDGMKKEFFSKKTESLSQENAIKRLITPGKFYGFAWNKMYKTSLVGKQRYDETILKGEDSPFSCEYILKCKKIVVQDIPLYHYRIDSISISRSCFNVGKMTVLNSYQNVVNQLVSCGYSRDVVDMQRVQYANQLLSLRTNIILSGKEKFLPQLKIIDSEMTNYEKIYVTSDLIDVKHKIAFILGVRLKFLFGFISKFYRG